MYNCSIEDQIVIRLHPFMSYIICTIKAKARNIPDTDTSGPKMMLIPHIQALPQIWVCSFLQHLHNSCEIQHDHNEWNAIFADKRAPHFVTTLGTPICIELSSCQQLQWSSGYHAGLWYLSSRVQIRLKLLDFSDKKILSMPSFGREVILFVPCRSFAACRKSLMIFVEVGS
jgi:hypothetical protein